MNRRQMKKAGSPPCPKSLILLVEQRGIEPLTSALRTRRSAKLSYCPTRRDILGSAREECQGVGEGAVEFLDVFAAALCHVGAAAAASLEQRAGFTHQHAHVARSVGGASEDQSCGVFVARAEQRDCLWLRDQSVREFLK